MNLPIKLVSGELMDSRTMAQLCRTLRGLEPGRTQTDVAALLSTDERNVSKQSISYAENPEYEGLDKLRIEIIELLSGQQVEGPFWRLKEIETNNG